MLPQTQLTLEVEVLAVVVYTPPKLVEEDVEEVLVLVLVDTLVRSVLSMEAALLVRVATIRMPPQPSTMPVFNLLLRSNGAAPFVNNLVIPRTSVLLWAVTNQSRVFTGHTFTFKQTEPLSSPSCFHSRTQSATTEVEEVVVVDVEEVVVEEVEEAVVAVVVVVVEAEEVEVEVEVV